MQGVYAHKDDVVVLVGELDDLLHLAVDFGANQSAESADTVVDVHDVVAHLDLVELFEREGQFARPGMVAFQRILVEAVENLVVGKTTYFQVVVDESLVQGFQHGGKGDGFAPLLEDGLQALNLFLAVAEYVDGVLFLDELGE